MSRKKGSLLYSAILKKVDCGIDSGKNAMEIAALLGFSEIHSYLAKHIWWCSIM